MRGAASTFRMKPLLVTLSIAVTVLEAESVELQVVPAIGVSSSLCTKTVLFAVIAVVEALAVVPPVARTKCPATAELKAAGEEELEPTASVANNWAVKVSPAVISSAVKSSVVVNAPALETENWLVLPAVKPSMNWVLLSSYSAPTGPVLAPLWNTKYPKPNPTRSEATIEMIYFIGFIG